MSYQPLTQFNPSRDLSASSFRKTGLSNFQAVMTALGCKDQSAEINEAQLKEWERNKPICVAIYNYHTNPNKKTAATLLSLVESDIKTVKENYAKTSKTYKQLKKQAKQEQEAAAQTNIFGQAFYGLVSAWTNFFETSADKLAENKYKPELDNLNQQLQELNKTKKELQAKVGLLPEYAQLKLVPDDYKAAEGPKTAEKIEPSSMSRRLLQTTLAPTIAQYCPPSGTCSLSSFNDGTSGTVYYGNKAGDNFGRTMISAGDINGDKYNDLLFSSYAASPNNLAGAGEVYVVFGNNQTSTGAYNISSRMTGVGGFKLLGDQAGENCGHLLGPAGDVNGDKYADIVIGCSYATANGDVGAGITFVIFGNFTSSWSAVAYNLTDLTINALRAFRMQGQGVSVYTGHSTGGGVDVNGDGSHDILVSAHRTSPNGKSYSGKGFIIAGSNRTGAWGTGSLNYPSLVNGTSGVEIYGANANDEFSYPLAGLGDVDNNGVDDVAFSSLKSSPNGLTSSGTVYVVLGSKQAGLGANSNITALIAAGKAFAIYGEQANDNLGVLVNNAGDVNGDKRPDILIGAYGSNLSGKLHIVFGRNSTAAWMPGIFNMSTLVKLGLAITIYGENPYDYFGYHASYAGDVNRDGNDDIVVGAFNSTLGSGAAYVFFGSTSLWNSSYNASTIRDGKYGFMIAGKKPGDNTGAFTSNAGDVNLDGIDDFMFGSNYDDPYNKTDAGSANVIYGDGGCQIEVNQLTITQGATQVFTTQNLYTNYSKPVNYNLTNITNCQFEYTTNPGQAITSFSQNDVVSGKVVVKHTGGPNPPTYTVEVLSTNKLVRYLPQDATINFSELFEVSTNQLVIHERQELVLNSSNLNITSNYPANQVNVTIANLFNAVFLISNSSVNRFLFSELLASLVSLRSNSNLSPSFDVIASNPVATLSPNPAVVDFYRQPTWQNIETSLTQGGSAVLNISVTEDDSPDNVRFTIDSLMHVVVRLLPLNTTISSFTLTQLLNFLVVIYQDFTANVPILSLTLSDSYFTLASQAMVFNFTRLPASLLNNRLTVFEGRNTSVTSDDFSAIDPDPNYNLDNEIFMISDIQNGAFFITGNPNEETQFTQLQVKNGQVIFVSYASGASASFKTAVNNSYTTSTPQSATVTFNARPIIYNFRVSIGEYETLALSLANIRAIDDTTFSGNILIKFSNITNCRFYQIQAPNVSITQTYQQRIADAEISLEAYGSKPGFTITAIDEAGLESLPKQAEIYFTVNQKSKNPGIDYQALYQTLSPIGGGVLAIGLYVLYRKRTTKQRRDFYFANLLRKAANLEYHDFNLRDGDTYKCRMEKFLARLYIRDPQFYQNLEMMDEQAKHNNHYQKSFAVCLAEQLKTFKLLSSSGFFSGIYGMTGLSVGWSLELDLNRFDKNMDAIVDATLKAWKSEANPLDRWPYFSPTKKDKCNACCRNNRPSRAKVFSEGRKRDGSSKSSISMTELGGQSPKDKDDLKLGVTSSPTQHSPSGPGLGFYSQPPISSTSSSSSPAPGGELQALYMTNKQLLARISKMEEQIRKWDPTYESGADTTETTGLRS